jgi:ketosteroid isomerase-like protein
MFQVKIRRLACFSALLFSCCAAFSQSQTATPTVNGVASTDKPEIAAIQKAEDSWSLAVNNRDQYGIELALSPLFVGVDANGSVTMRNQQVAELINGDDKTLHLDQKVVTVRMLGDVAVANGTYTLHHKGASGPIDEKGVFTHVFQRVHNNWYCINSQRTLLREDGPQSKTKKKSDAELPFHIPIFSKN